MCTIASISLWLAVKSAARKKTHEMRKEHELGPTSGCTFCNRVSERLFNYVSLLALRR